MKKYRFLVGFIYLSVCAFAFSTPTAQKIYFSGSFSAPHAVSEYISSLRVYHNGNIIELDSNGSFFLVKEPHQRDFLFIFIAEPTQPRENTIKHLEIPADSTYKCFAVHLEAISDNKARWLLSSKTLSISATSDGKRLDIPDNAIIVATDPAYIDRIERTSCNAYGNMIQLPRIVFKKELAADTFKEAHEKIRLAFVDWDMIHTRRKTETKRLQNVLLSTYLP